MDRRAVFVGMGFEIVGLLLVGVWAGAYFDKKFNLQGMATAGLVVLALILWFLHLLQLIKNINNDQDQNSSH